MCLLLVLCVFANAQDSKDSKIRDSKAQDSNTKDSKARDLKARVSLNAPQKLESTQPESIDSIKSAHKNEAITESADSMNAINSADSSDNLSAESTKESAKESTKDTPFIPLYAHKASYFLPFYHSFTKPTEGNIDNETKFQFSFRLRVLKASFHSLNFAYTQTAFFQNYHKADSRPFRDIDYQPEVFYRYERDLAALGGAFKYIQAGYNHLSNGERALRSRTQNRMLVSSLWEYEFDSLRRFGVILSVWAYMGRNLDGFLHDNADLTKYRGYGDILMFYKGRRHWFEAYMRPSRYPFFELAYTLKITSNMGLYCQYIHGYGDNMFEYNLRAQRVGVGVRLWNK